jgi:hypothetical protein
MEVTHWRCSGLDVHKEIVVACVRLEYVNLVQFYYQVRGTLFNAPRFLAASISARTSSRSASGM